MEKLVITYKNVDELIPYINNPRKNEKAVDMVAGSIAEFGFKNPIILDKNNVIIAGHTRLLAARKVGMTEIPTIQVGDLTEQQIKAFRIADNRTAEFSEWDDDLLKQELLGLEELFTGFDLAEFEELPNEFEEVEGEIKFTEELGEESNYIVLKFDTSVDWLQLETLFEIKRVKGLSSKPGYEQIGRGRVVDGADFLYKVMGDDVIGI